MLGGVFTSAVTPRLAQVYNTNSSKLAENYMRVASGKRILKPADNIVDFLHAQNTERTGRGYQNVRQEISIAKGIVDIAESAGSMLFEDVKRMAELVTLYQSATATSDEQLAYRAEFNSLKEQATQVLDNTTYNGTQLFSDTSASPLATLNLDPNDQAQEYKISYAASVIIDPAALTALDITAGTAVADVDVQLGKAGGFLGTTTAFRMGLDAQYSIADQHMRSDSAQVSSLRDADVATEMSKQVDYQIRTSSSIAMMSQANMISGAMLRLFR